MLTDACRVAGPYRDRNQWRVRVIDLQTRKRTSHLYPTFEEAMEAIPQLSREYRRPVGLPLPKALALYAHHLATRGNTSRGANKPRTIETTMQRLTSLFTSKHVTGDLTVQIVTELWAAWVVGKATDTALNTLAQTKTFLYWLDGKGMLSVPPSELLQIDVYGRRKKGKPQLTHDEADRLLLWCWSHPTDKGGIATAMAFLLGMRASEIVDRLVRDLDNGGTLLDISEAKTSAGDRGLALPVKIQVLLRGLATGKKSEDRLFGDVDRHWLLREVKRCCADAGVRVVTPHGLRGTHARVGRSVGVSGVLLAQAMGHEKESTNIQHYSGREVVRQAGIDQLTKMMDREHEGERT